MWFRIALVPLLLSVGCASIGRSLYEGDQNNRRNEIGFREGVSTIDGLQMEFLERDGDGTPILLIHGFSGSKNSWNRFSPFLGGEHRLVSPSLIGHGASSFAEGLRFDFATQADRLAILLDNLKVERAHLIGVSMGGAVATTFAARHPDRVITLNVICPAGIRPPTLTPFQESWRAGKNELIIGKTDEYSNYLELLFYGEPPSIPGPVRAFLAEELVEQAPRLTVIDADFRRKPGWLEEVIPLVKAPTLVVWGKEDEIVHPSGATAFEVLPEDQRRIVILEGCGHACVYVRAEEVASLINENIDKK